MWKFAEFSVNYSNTCESLWQHYRYELSLTAYNAVQDFTGADHNSKS